MGSQMIDETVDLVVIGGGPTGLLSAMLASRLGLSVSVIDAKPHTLEVGRADALNARTQQYLEVAGVLDELLPQGITCNTSSTFSHGEFKSRQSHWWTSLEHCFRRNFLMIGQPVVEKALQNRLSDDVSIHYGERVAAVSENMASVDDHVLVQTDSGRTIRGLFAIAADGARSTVRNLLNIGFTGTKPEMIWAVLDTFIDTDFPVCPEIVTFQLDGQARVSWIPRERGMARFYVLLDGQITQERAEESIRRHMAPHRIDFVETEWFSTFEVKERIASTFISEGSNILLAGDAAHVHSVNGGQGLNTGIADAFALAWRIATAVKGPQVRGLSQKTTQSLLLSYDTERRAIAQDVINVAALLVRDTMRTAEEYVQTIERNAGYITGMGVSYDNLKSPLIVESGDGRTWKAGKRCPDIWLRRRSGSQQAVRLYSLVSYGDFLVITAEANPKQTRGVEKDCHRNETLVSLRVCSLFDGPNRGQGQQGELEFLSADVETENGFSAVVRPDMYIGYVGSQDGRNEYVAKLSLLGPVS